MASVVISDETFGAFLLRKGRLLCVRSYTSAVSITATKNNNEISAYKFHCIKSQECAQHKNLTVGEIYKLEKAENHCITDCHQCVDTAQSYAVDYLLNEHIILSPFLVFAFENIVRGGEYPSRNFDFSNNYYCMEASL